MPPRDDNRVILEFIQRGAYVKVSAIDPVTGTEVSIVGDPTRGEAALRQLAIRKLHYVMDKQKNDGRR
jgi:hypothetical protein